MQQITYTFHTESPVHFSLDPHPQLSIGRASGIVRFTPLPSDSDGHLLSLTAHVRSRQFGGGSASDHVQLVVRLVDKPQFGGPTLALTTGSSSTGGTLQLYAGGNVDKYSLVDDTSDTLQIDSTSGVITLPDRPENSTTTAQVEACNAGGCSRLSLAIAFDDSSTNAHTPHFDSQLYRFQAATSAAPIPIGRVHARDSDEGRDGFLRYRLAAADTVQGFSIDETNGELHSWNAEPTEHRFQVISEDSPLDFRHAKSASTVVVIRIVDALVNADAQFTRAEYRFHVAENVQSRMRIGQVDTTQPTSSMRLSDCDDAFQLDSDSGTLYSNRPLDRERRADYRCSLDLSDNQSALLVVIVDDVNDNAPRFERFEPIVFLSTQTQVGSEIFRLRAEDADSSLSEIRYRLLSDDDSESGFLIEPDSGVVRLLGKVEEAAGARYRLRVVATDSGGLESEAAEVHVSVVDSMPPDSASEVSMSVDVSDKTKPGEAIARVESVASARFELVAGESEAMFEIDSASGRLFLKRSLLGASRRSLMVRVRVMQGDGEEAEKLVKLNVSVAHARCGQDLTV